MNEAARDTLLSSVERLNAVLGGMDDQDELYDEEGQMYADAQALTDMRNVLAALAADTSPQARVLVSISGGVADFISEGSVDVEVFDHDNYEADPEATGLPSSKFESLARRVQSIDAIYATKEKVTG